MCGGCFFFGASVEVGFGGVGVGFTYGVGA